MSRALQTSESSPSPASPPDTSGICLGSHSERSACIWPRGPSTDPRWKPNNGEEKLLEFLESLILDLARNHPRVTGADVAAWLASVAAGSPKIEKLEELHAWQRKAVLAKDFLEKFPGCTPARQFLERFKEKFDYEFRL